VGPHDPTVVEGLLHVAVGGAAETDADRPLRRRVVLGLDRPGVADDVDGVGERTPGEPVARQAKSGDRGDPRVIVRHVTSM
jgi:hypothetical protein